MAPGYINDDTLMGSIWRTLCTPGIAIEIRFGDPQTAQGLDRRAWAAQVREAVERLRAGVGA